MHGGSVSAGALYGFAALLVLLSASIASMAVACIRVPRGRRRSFLAASIAVSAATVIVYEVAALVLFNAIHAQGALPALLLIFGPMLVSTLSAAFVSRPFTRK